MAFGLENRAAENIDLLILITRSRCARALVGQEATRMYVLVYILSNEVTPCQDDIVRQGQFRFELCRRHRPWASHCTRIGIDCRRHYWSKLRQMSCIVRRTSVFAVLRGYEQDAQRRSDEGQIWRWTACDAAGCEMPQNSMGVGCVQTAGQKMRLCIDCLGFGDGLGAKSRYSISSIRHRTLSLVFNNPSLSLSVHARCD